MTIVAGEPIVLENRNDTTNARPIVEVFSKSRKNYDRGDKFERDRSGIFKNIFDSSDRKFMKEFRLRPVTISDI